MRASILSISEQEERHECGQEWGLRLTLPSAKYWPPAVSRTFSNLVSQLHRDQNNSQGAGTETGFSERNVRYIAIAGKAIVISIIHAICAAQSHKLSRNGAPGDQPVGARDSGSADGYSSNPKTLRGRRCCTLYCMALTLYCMALTLGWWFPPTPCALPSGVRTKEQKKARERRRREKVESTLLGC